MPWRITAGLMSTSRFKLQSGLTDAGLGDAVLITQFLVASVEKIATDAIIITEIYRELIEAAPEKWTGDRRWVTLRDWLFELLSSPIWAHVKYRQKTWYGMRCLYVTMTLFLYAGLVWRVLGAERSIINNKNKNRILLTKKKRLGWPYDAG